MNSSLARRIEAMLRAQIADGSLPPGARLPSTRALAAELGVSRTTVTTVYEQLAAEGCIDTSPGRAARVTAGLQVGQAGQAGQIRAEPRPADRAAPRLSALGHRLAAMPMPALPTVAQSECIDFLYGAIAAADHPARLWLQACQAELRQPQQRLYYDPPQGDPALRQALQGHLRRARGLDCDAERILIVHGSQQAIDLCARVLLDGGDRFVIEDPAYLMARRCFELTGAHALPVPVDAHGLMTDRLPEGAAPVRLAYVTPSHQFPLGGVLPLARRQALLHWAAQQQAWIIEDDYDGEFRYGQRPIDALQAMDTEGRVIHVGTFSKTLSPQLRLGYMVLPPALVAVFVQAKRLCDRHAPRLEQRVLARLIDSGAYERHVRRQRRRHERRRAALLEAVARHLGARARVAGDAAGLHVVLWLPGLPAACEPALIAAARARQLIVHPVSPLHATPQEGGRPSERPAGLVLGYASLEAAQIDAGLRRLADALAALQPA